MKFVEETTKKFGEEIMKLANLIGGLAEDGVGLEINFEMNPSDVPSYEIKISRNIVDGENVVGFKRKVDGRAKNVGHGEEVVAKNVREYDLRPDSDVYYYIDFGVSSFVFSDDEYDNEKIECGNFFGTRGEAEEFAETIKGMVGRVKVRLI